MHFTTSAHQLDNMSIEYFERENSRWLEVSSGGLTILTLFFSDAADVPEIMFCLAETAANVIEELGE